MSVRRFGWGYEVFAGRLDSNKRTHGAVQEADPKRPTAAPSDDTVAQLHALGVQVFGWTRIFRKGVQIIRAYSTYRPDTGQAFAMAAHIKVEYVVRLAGALVSRAVLMKHCQRCTHAGTPATMREWNGRIWQAMTR